MSLLAALVQKTWQSSRICGILCRTFDFSFTDVSRDSFPGIRVQNCNSLVHHCSQLWNEHIRWGTCSVSNTDAKLPTSQGMVSVVSSVVSVNDKRPWPDLLTSLILPTELSKSRSHQIMANQIGHNEFNASDWLVTLGSCYDFVFGMSSGRKSSFKIPQPEGSHSLSHRDVVLFTSVSAFSIILNFEACDNQSYKEQFKE